MPLNEKIQTQDWTDYENQRESSHNYSQLTSKVSESFVMDDSSPKNSMHCTKFILDTPFN